MNSFEAFLTIATSTLIVVTLFCINYAYHSFKEITSQRHQIFVLTRQCNNNDVTIAELKEEIEDLQVYQKTCSKLALVLHERILLSTTPETNSAYLVIQDILDKTISTEHMKLYNPISYFNKDK